MSGHPRGTARSITKTVRIACDPDRTFRFLGDLANWPRWAIVNVKSVRRTDDPEWWEMMTPHGAARIRIRADARHRIFDHDWVDPQASWTVYSRVIPNGDGAEFLITFFDQQIKLVDVELAKLKEILESA